MGNYRRGTSQGSAKYTSKKNRLLKATRRAKSVPTWVIVKTNRQVRSNPKQRNWRRRKLGLK
ncbi:MAG: 50S ribosomal protein L39e [Thaumarchaeota archaeon]|nr:50S ribosomal protein L39e [Nitrososphaerota archaeon]